MSDREEHERRRMEALLPDEGEAAVRIFATMSRLGKPGDPMTPELARRASQVAGAEAGARCLKDGHTYDDLWTMRRYFEYVGDHIAEDLELGGRLDGATVPDPEHDEVGRPDVEDPRPMLTSEKDGPLACSFCGRDMFAGLMRVAWRDLDDLRVDHGTWGQCPQALAAVERELDASLHESGYDVSAMNRAFAKGHYGADPSYFKTENVRARARLRRRALIACITAALVVAVVAIWLLSM